MVNVDWILFESEIYLMVIFWDIKYNVYIIFKLYLDYKRLKLIGFVVVKLILVLIIKE